MKNGLQIAALLVSLAGWLTPVRASAGVVVVSNKTAQEVRFSVTAAQGPAQEHTVEAGDLITIPTASRVEVSFMSGQVQRRIELDPDSIYYFSTGSDRLDLRELRLPTGADQRSGASASPDRKRPTSPPRLDPSGARRDVDTIPVKILVDDDEPCRQREGRMARWLRVMARCPPLSRGRTARTRSGVHAHTGAERSRLLPGCAGLERGGEAAHGLDVLALELLLGAPIGVGA